jgi:hypothetical protein
MRTVPYSLSFSQQLSAFDSGIRAVAETIIGPTGFDSPAGSLARQQMLLPVSRGGLGLRSTARTLLATALGSWSRVASTVSSRFPILSAAVSTEVETGALRFQSCLRASRDLLPASAQQLLPPFHQLGLQAVPALQEQLTDAMETERAESLRESMVDSVGRARVLSETGLGAWAFLGAVPFMQSLRFTDECFRTSLPSTWLGLPHPAIAEGRWCECGEELREGPLGGQHLLRCSRGGERTLTHDGIRDTLFGILPEASYSVRREARGILPLREGDTEGRVMDLVAADPDGGPRLLIDVTVADPLRTAAESAIDRGHAAV